MKGLYKKGLSIVIGTILCLTTMSACGGRRVSDTLDSGDSSEVFTFSLPSEPEEADIYVEPIEDISDDFIRGMDASSVLAVENSGAVFYNYNSEEQDVFKTLAQSGVNYIRLRVWNDPYDENGNGYGGGNNDLATAIELGQRATQYGMKVCIDFHYSDFWADPKRQHAPKAWENMSVDEKCDALYQFTKDSLTQLIEAGVNVGMVQIGNEINNGMSGEKGVSSVMKLLVCGSNAVREISDTYQTEIQIAVHYTNIEDNAEIDSMASCLLNAGVDYDIFGLSYYPFWDGTNDNMQTVAENLQDKYGKKVMIAETSYCYTSEDGDGFDNSFAGNSNLVDGYPATVQGQASIIRDICEAANEVGVIGIFYWEGTWIPVGDVDADNSPLWEQYGSGWASSYAADYDPQDAGLYYGGCSWDNQAMFDFDGYPLASLNVFKYLRYGTTTSLAIDHIPEVMISCNAGEDLIMPDTVEVIYNDATKVNLPVLWDETSVAAIDTNVGGTYEVLGALEDGTKVTGCVEVILVNLVLNPGFEDTDTSMWNITYEGEINPTDYLKKAEDAYSGDIAFHFWSENTAMDFAIEQEFTNLEPGTYELSMYSQGGDTTTDSSMELYAIANGEEVSIPFELTTYIAWKHPVLTDINVTDGSLTIGVRIKSNAKSWGTVDDFKLNRISD